VGRVRQPKKALAVPRVAEMGTLYQALGVSEEGVEEVASVGMQVDLF
jgi:hypothetical protein